MSQKFSKRWLMEQTGPKDFCVYDADGRKLFYIVGDEEDGTEGDEDYIASSVLFSDDKSHAELVDEICLRLGILSAEAQGYQNWIDEVQRITCEFVQDDEGLGTLMLDASERYWDRCFEDGLTPQQALDKFIAQLQQPRKIAR